MGVGGCGGWRKVAGRCLRGSLVGRSGARCALRGVEHQCPGELLRLALPRLVRHEAALAVQELHAHRPQLGDAALELAVLYVGRVAAGHGDDGDALADAFGDDADHDFAGKAMFTYRYSCRPAVWERLLTRAGFSSAVATVLDAPEPGHIGTLIVRAEA